MILAVGDYALLRLHEGDSIPSAPNRNLDQQYMGPFRVTEKVGLLCVWIRYTRRIADTSSVFTSST